MLEQGCFGLSVDCLGLAEVDFGLLRATAVLGYWVGFGEVERGDDG